MKQTTTQRVWISGTGTLVITIPKNIREIQQIEPRDYVEITIEKIENETTKAIKKELEKIEEQEQIEKLEKQQEIPYQDQKENNNEIRKGFIIR